MSRPEPLPTRPITRALVVRWSLLSLAVVALMLVVVAALFAATRRAALGDGAAALATMTEPRPPPPAGRNGFGELFLLGHEVPPPQVDAVLADAVRWREAYWPMPFDESDVTTPAPESAYPIRPALADDQYCPASTCLAWVREHADTMRSLTVAESARFAAAERGWTADYLRNPFPPGPDQPLPDYKSFRLVLASAAWAAVDGRTEQAYATTCGLLDGGRRLSADPGNVIDKMIGVATATAAAHLLLDLRREYPVATLPPACADAVAAPAEPEWTMCEAMRGEFRTYHSVSAMLDEKMRRMKPWLRPGVALLLDGTLQDGWVAEPFADWCHPATIREHREGHIDLGRIGRPPVEMYSARCFTAYLSCVLANIAAPRYSDYAKKSLDEIAKRQLLLAAQRVADGDGTPRDLVGDEITPNTPVEWDESGTQATIRLRIAKAGPESWTLDFSGLAPSPARAAPQPE